MSAMYLENDIRRIVNTHKGISSETSHDDWLKILSEIKKKMIM